MSRQKLQNYFVVEDNILMRGGCLNSGGFSKLSSMGVKTVINLRYKFKIREEFSQKGGVKIYSLPFAPFRPKDEIFLKFFKILKDESLLPAYVHCFHGRDRTGLACAMYRIIIQGWSKEKAIAEMRSCGLNWWQKNMIEYIKRLDVQSFKKNLSNSA